MGKRSYKLKWSLLIPVLLWAACTKTTGSNNLSSIESVGGGSTDSLSDVSAVESIAPVTLSGGSATLTLNHSSDYLLIVNSTRSGSNTTVQLSASQSVKTAKKPSALTLSTASDSVINEDNEPLLPPEEFHEFMRAMEEVLPHTETVLANSSMPSVSALQAAMSVGTVRSFKSLSSLNSITSYETLDATLMYTSSNLYVFVDNRNLENISEASIQSLAYDFETIAVPTERSLFGEESDVNDDGHVTILMTQVVNHLTSTGGLITGYFFPGDLFASSSTNPASNEQEIFYTLVPDPNGDNGVPISEPFTVNNVLPGVLAHEYQHMISYNQKVFIQGGSTEEPWLNEALSHFSEDITGFGNENPARERIFLANPSQISIAPNSSPTLGQRGGSYLFVRYMYEQSSNGTAFIQNLYRTADTGTGNIQQAFGGTDSNFDEFPEFVNQWATALVLSNTGLSSDSRYNYRTRTINSQTGNYMGVLLRGDTQDGRGTVLSGPTVQRVESYPSSATIGSATTQIFRLVAPSGSIQLNTGSGSSRAALVQLTTH
ncbi:MAG: hypothetical protein IPJ69_12795 [Deltaproteobacteria bacterium]|nr:MAG: hypothetical protein IPJ69_12795 [Deltaproteobacteria bacterium]